MYLDASINGSSVPHVEEHPQVQQQEPQIIAYDEYNNPIYAQPQVQQPEYSQQYAPEQQQYHQPNQEYQPQQYVTPSGNEVYYSEPAPVSQQVPPAEEAYVDEFNTMTEYVTPTQEVAHQTIEAPREVIHNPEQQATIEQKVEMRNTSREGENVFRNLELASDPQAASTSSSSATTAMSTQVVSAISGYPVNPSYTANPMAALIQATVKSADPSSATTWQAGIVLKVVQSILRGFRK